ncbi:peptidylprolyl isomerase [Nanoarchaeota archaeon]
MTKILLNDFIEVEYTGKFADGTIFDTTNQEVAQKNNIFSPEMKYKPVIICVGEKQLILGLDDALLGKEVGKEYTIDLKPEEAFGKRDIKKIRLVPLAEFKKRRIDPRPGMQIDMDGEVGIIKNASGGRIIVNFNHPFSGKEVVYEIKINKKITDKKEKLTSYLEISLNSDNFKTDIKDDKATISLPVELPEIVQEEFSKKLKEIIGLKDIVFKKAGETQQSPVKTSTTPKQ